MPLTEVFIDFQDRQIAQTKLNSEMHLADFTEQQLGRKQNADRQRQFQAVLVLLTHLEVNDNRLLADLGSHVLNLLRVQCG